MTINQTGLSFDSLRRFAEAVRGISKLPGIPTAGWCAEASASAARLVPGSVATLRLVEVSGAGEFAGVLSAGAYDSQKNDEIDPALLSVEGECVGAWWMLATARTVTLNGSPLAGTLRAAPGCERWEFSTLGRRWSSMGVTELWVGARALIGGGGGGTRFAVLELGARGGESPDPGHAAATAEMVRALMPEVALRAGLAFAAAGMPEGEATLTHREYEVLTLLSRGRTVKQIAEALTRSPHTVHDHVKALHRKLGASSRGELVARALGHIDTEGNIVAHDPAHESKTLASAG